MMDRFLRLALIVLTAGGLAACDEEDSAAPVGETSTVNVSVFVEDDGTAGMSAGDDPVAGATVTLVANESDDSLTATTGANGIATFLEVPAGVYTVTHTPNPAITNATLTSTLSQTIVAQFEGGTTEASFVYSYNPGSISGRFFRDENDNNTYEELVDTTLAGFQILLFGGTDTLLVAGEARDTVTVDSTGTFAFGSLAPGEYTLLIRPILGSEVTDTVLSVTLEPDEDENLLIEFTGGDAIATIAQLRALPIGSSATVEGVVTAGTGVYSTSSFYMQDATAGILVFLGSSTFTTLDVAAGDSLRVTGTTSLFSQEMQLGGGAALEIEVLGRVAPRAPRTVTVSDILANLYQGELVTINGLIVDSLPAAVTSSNWNMRAHDATGSMIIFFDTDAGISSGTFAVGQTWNITGLGTSFNALREIKPRGAGDIVLVNNPGGTMPIATARALPNGQVATVRGVVTAGPQPDTVFSGSSFYVQDNTGGILVFCGGTGGISCAAFGAGDSVTVTGTTAIFSGEEQLTGSATQTLVVTEHGPGTIPAPVLIDAADVNAGRFQGRLARADSVTVLSKTGETGNVTLTVQDPFGTFQVFLDTDTGLTGAMFTVGSRYRLVGILASFIPSGQPIQYQLKPRSSADVTAL